MTSVALRFAPLMLLLVQAGPAQASDNLLTTPGAAARAVEEIVAKIGRKPAMSLIEIMPDAVMLQVQGEKPYHVDEWRWNGVEFWYFKTSYISGPQPVQSSTPVDDVAASFFPLSDVKLDLAPEIVASAIKRAALEEAAKVENIRIERSVSIFPKPQFGEPRWTVRVRSDREDATIYAALDGTIIGANLSGTQRARMFDLFADDSHFDGQDRTWHRAWA